MKNDKLKNQVQEILYWKQYTRNSDIYLWTEIVNKFYWSQSIAFANGVRSSKSPEEASRHLKEFMLSVPNQDHVKRYRAKFNEKMKFLPTDPKIAKARKLNQDLWKTNLGYEGLLPGDKLEFDRQEKHIQSIRAQSKLL